jgi:hypothetical protein
MNSNDQTIVEEFPKPPKYYECFRAKEGELAQMHLDSPPPIPQTDEDIYDIIYDKSFSKSKLPSMGSLLPSEEGEDCNFKSDIKR